MLAPPLDAADAMTITIVAAEAFSSLPELSPELARGALLLYDQIMQRVKPLLPDTPAMAHVFAGIETARQIANQVRRLDGVPEQGH